MEEEKSFIEKVRVEIYSMMFFVFIGILILIIILGGII